MNVRNDIPSSFAFTDPVNEEDSKRNKLPFLHAILSVKFKIYQF